MMLKSKRSNGFRGPLVGAAIAAAALVGFTSSALAGGTGKLPSDAIAAHTPEEHAALAEGYRRQAAEVGAKAAEAERRLATVKRAGGKIQQNLIGVQSERVRQYRAQEAELVQLAESHERHVDFAKK
jgi:hypothetical protein